MDDVLYVQCPNKQCGKVLSFKAFPNYKEARITCPFCEYQAKIKEFMSFVPKKSAQKTPQQHEQSRANAPMPPMPPAQPAPCRTPMQQPMGPAQQPQKPMASAAVDDPTVTISDLKVFIQCIDNKMKFELKPGKNIIGRTSAQPKATILFPDPEKYLSRNHASITVMHTPQGIEIRLVDNGSVNGTFVQGKRLPAGTICKIPANIVITLGRLRFIVFVESAGSTGTSNYGNTPNTILM